MAKGSSTSTQTEHSLEYKLLLLLFFPIRVIVHLIVFIFWGAQFYLFPHHVPELRHMRNETLFILAGIGIILMFALWDAEMVQKLIASIGIFVATVLCAHLLNEGDEGFLN